MIFAKSLVSSTGVALCLLISGCSTPPKPPPRPADYVVLLPTSDGALGKVFIKGSKGEQTLSSATEGALLDGSTPPALIAESQIQKDFGSAIRARPVEPEHFYLYFESGGSVLTRQSQALIPTILEKTKGRESADVSVIGHTDTAGKADANARLAYERATTIANMLRERGLQAATLTIESHGESNLLVQTPDETPEPRNRRVEITVR